LDQEGFFGETMRAAIAIGTAYQVGTHVLPPAVVRVGTRIEIAFLGPYTGQTHTSSPSSWRSTPSSPGSLAFLPSISTRFLA
jgi:hypothetical protein